MFYSTRMRKVTIVGPHTLMQKTISRLHALNVLHVVEHEKTAELDIGKPLASAEKIAELLLDVDMLWNALEIDKNGHAVHQRKSSTMNFRDTEAKIQHLAAEVSRIVTEKQAVSAGLARKRQEKLLLDVLRRMKLSQEDVVHAYSSIDVIFGAVGKITPLLQEMKEAQDAELFHTPHEDKEYVALFCKKADRESLLSLLSKHGFVSADTSFLKHASPSLQKEIAALEEKLGGLQARLKSMNKDYGYFLVTSRYYLSEEAKKAELPLKFGSTNKAFVVTGFIPQKRYSIAIPVLQAEMVNSLYIIDEPLKKGESVPVELDNPKAVEPFQFFMDLYSLPKYKELDPSFLFFMAFPLFFGFMLGDIGYGLATLALFYLLYRAMKGKVARQLLKVMMYAALASILFGFVFGEFFGFETYPAALGERLCGAHLYCEEIIEGGAHGAAEGGVIYELPRLITRAKEIDKMLSIAVLIGIVHLFFGYILGFINVLKAHGFRHAFIEKVGWLFMFPLIIKILLVLDLLKGGIASFFLSFIPGWMICAGIAAAGVIMIGFANVYELVEVPGLFGNILSYARLMAIALASVGLAAVVNQMTGQLAAAGIIGIIGGILVFAAGHAINIALGVLGPFLHSLRLHYVEFFTKFFKGGGKRYIPFGAEE